MDTACCIAGGGPAGMMLGVLLARAGVDVVVLEKHGDFLRDFRGDTIHPSTLQLMHELGWLEEFLRLPHQKVDVINGQIGDLRVPMGDFSHLPVAAPYIAMMPQWDFLNFLADKARAYPSFHLLMHTRAEGLIEEGSRIAGVRARAETGESLEIRAALTIAADGRDSALVPAAGLRRRDLGAPMDVLWFKLSLAKSDSPDTLGRFDAGRIFVQINRGTHWQCAYVIPKGGHALLVAQGLAHFHAAIAAVAPFAADRLAGDIPDFDAVKLLTVTVDRLERWHRPGFLAIGDAAHAMSPVGGVGVNLAVQDAVAAANRLTSALLTGTLDDAALADVQTRRMFPMRVTQAMQVFIQNRVIAPTLAMSGTLKPPMVFRLMARWGFLRRLMGRFVGMGVRPEHIAPLKS